MFSAIHSIVAVVHSETYCKFRASKNIISGLYHRISVDISVEVPSQILLKEFVPRWLILCRLAVTMEYNRILFFSMLSPRLPSRDGNPCKATGRQPQHTGIMRVADAEVGGRSPVVRLKAMRGATVIYTHSDSHFLLGIYLLCCIQR